MDKHWLKSYPEGVPPEIHPQQYSSLTQLLEESFRKNASRPFSVCMEQWMTYGQLDELSKALGNRVGGLPFSIVFGADGVVRHRRMGRVSQADLKQWADLG